jgi:GNAT superfamily N-acetyltransferase
MRGTGSLALFALPHRFLRGHDPVPTGAGEQFGYVDRDDEVAACFGLMQQLRPHLTDVDEFVTRWRRQVAEGYRLMVLRRAARPVALAGFRVQENLVHGRHFYVDDLVTDPAERSAGLGGRVMLRLIAEGRSVGCATLILDTPLANVLGHRFYYRQGLLARALRFYMPLG